MVQGLAFMSNLGSFKGEGKSGQGFIGVQGVKLKDGFGGYEAESGGVV